MLFAETVRLVKEEQKLIDDPTQYPPSATQDNVYGSTEYTTTSTSYVLIQTMTIDPSDGNKAVIVKLQADMKISVSGFYAYVKVTVQPAGGSETTLWETSTTSATYVTLSSIVDYVPASAVQLTVRWYIRSYGTSYTVYCKNRYVYYHHVYWRTTKNYGSIQIQTNNTLVYFKFTAASNVFMSVIGGFRFKVGSAYAVAGMLNRESKTVSGLVMLNAGSYEIIFEADTKHVTVKDFVFVSCRFTYVQGMALQQFAGGDINLNIQHQKILIGETNEGSIEIRCSAYTPGEPTNFANPGETPTNAITLTIDTIQRSWVERVNDSQGVGAAYALFRDAVGVANHTITIAKANSNTVLYVSIVFCPWFLANVETAPFSLNIPAGSTLYVILAPFTSDPTKTIKLKAARVAIGGGGDAISQASGTGTLVWNYTFEYVDPLDALITVSGDGGCIQSYAVDVRM